MRGGAERQKLFTMLVLMKTRNNTVLAWSYFSEKKFLSESEKAYADTNTYEQNLELLARAVNGEARGEIYEGQVAVAAVILNRVKHPSFPNTIAGVI